MTKYSTYDVQVMDRATGQAVISTGGKAIVTTAGAYNKKALYDPDADFAVLANAISATRGKFRFACATAPQATSVDIYGYGPGGHWFVARNCQAGKPTEVWIDSFRRHQTAVVPWLASTYTDATESDTGLDFIAGSVLLPQCAVTVVTAQASKTVDIGLLSSESGGDADGLFVAQSTTTAGTYVGRLVSGTATLGALLKETTTGAAAVIPVPYTIAAAVSIAFTGSSGATTAAGLFEIDLILPATT